MTKTKTPGRWKKWTLAVSMLLNLVLIGMLGGVMLRGAPDGSLMRAAIGALPDDARREMRRTGREAFRGRHGHSELRAARADLLTALRAETFDEAAFRTSLDVAQARLLQMSDRLEAALLNRVVQMDVSARRAMADRLEKRTGRLARAPD